jgi:hypothetical protein
VGRAYGLARRPQGRLAQQVLRPGRRAYRGWWAGPCGRVPGLGQAVLAAADDGPGWWLRLPNLQQRRRRDRPERLAVPQVGLRMGRQVGLRMGRQVGLRMGRQAEPQGSGAAAQAYLPAARVERSDRSG